MATQGTSLGGVQQARVEVPSWDGEPDKLLNYKFDVMMFAKSYRLADRYVVGPQLIRALGPRTRLLAQGSPDINEIEETDRDGKLIGWTRVFDYLLSKLDMTNVNELGAFAEEFFSKMQRASGEAIPDWTASIVWTRCP